MGGRRGAGRGGLAGTKAGASGRLAAIRLGCGIPFGSSAEFGSWQIWLAAIVRRGSFSGGGRASGAVVGKGAVALDSSPRTATSRRTGRLKPIPGTLQATAAALDAGRF